LQRLSTPDSRARKCLENSSTESSGLLFRLSEPARFRRTTATRALPGFRAEKSGESASTSTPKTVSLNDGDIIRAKTPTFRLARSVAALGHPGLVGMV